MTVPPPPNLDDADPARVECGAVAAGGGRDGGRSDDGRRRKTDARAHPPPLPANCGETAGLLRCSRCRGVWFCGRACQKVWGGRGERKNGRPRARPGPAAPPSPPLPSPQSYWPFHRDACRSNDFADAVEADEPGFAAWLRRHGRQARRRGVGGRRGSAAAREHRAAPTPPARHQAALKDDEIDRLERAGAAASGETPRAAVMASLYGRADPSPAPAAYTRAEVAAVAAREAADRDAAALLTDGDRAWAAATPPPAARATGGALAAGAARWWQTPVSATLVLRLPPGAGRVAVAIERGRVRVEAGGAAILDGAPFRAVSPPLSTWSLCDAVVTLTLVKASRRGRYADGETAADTWWRALLREGEGGGARAGGGGAALAVAALPLLPPTPPVEYYALPDDAGDDAVRWRGRRG